MCGAGQALGAPMSPTSPSPCPHLLPLPFACSSLPGTSNRPRICSVWFIMQVCKYIIYYFPHHYPLFIT